MEITEDTAVVKEDAKEEVKDEFTRFTKSESLENRRERGDSFVSVQQQGAFRFSAEAAKRLGLLEAGYTHVILSYNPVRDQVGFEFLTHGYNRDESYRVYRTNNSLLIKCMGFIKSHHIDYSSPVRFAPKSVDSMIVIDLSEGSIPEEPDVDNATVE